MTKHISQPISDNNQSIDRISFPSLAPDDSTMSSAKEGLNSLSLPEITDKNDKLKELASRSPSSASTLAERKAISAAKRMFAGNRQKIERITLEEERQKVRELDKEVKAKGGEELARKLENAEWKLYEKDSALCNIDDARTKTNLLDAIRSAQQKGVHYQDIYDRLKEHTIITNHFKGIKISDEGVEINLPQVIEQTIDGHISSSGRPTPYTFVKKLFPQINAVDRGISRTRLDTSRVIRNPISSGE